MAKKSLRDSLCRLGNWVRRPEVLLCPQIPQPMHGVNPREILGNIWWNKTRREAYRSTDYHCVACSVHKSKAKYHHWLEGHELYEIDYPRGRMTYVETVPLCNACHNYIHLGRLQSLVDNGEVAQARLNGVIRHGNKVLRDAGLVKSDVLITNAAEWGDWRLVIDGKLYPPKFRSYEEWESFYG